MDLVVNFVGYIEAINLISMTFDKKTTNLIDSH